MKIAITGHTRGIGKACAQALSVSHKTIGFSRSNDRALPQCMREVIIESRAADAFVINADPWSQLDLFKQLYTIWQNQSKHIIVIGSRAAFMKPETEYRAVKRQLRDHVLDVQLCQPRVCKITQIHPGFINEHLTADHVADHVVQTLEAPYELGEISLWANDK